MARPPTPSLTDGELRLMRALWLRGPSTVVEIQSAIGDPLAESTVRTLLGILQDKGYVERRKDGRAFVYNARVSRREARRSGVRQLLDRFFGSRVEMVLSLLDEQELSSEELERMRCRLDEMAAAERR